MRGGQNAFFIRLGTRKVSAPQESIDRLIALNEEAVALGAVSAGVKFCAFLAAVRRNIDLTVLVHNNQVYGLTKG